MSAARGDEVVQVDPEFNPDYVMGPGDDVPRLATPDERQRLGLNDGVVAIAPEDEARPVVGFLRMAGWSDERIAEVVEAHKRGETPTYSVTIGGPNA